MIQTLYIAQTIQGHGWLQGTPCIKVFLVGCDKICAGCETRAKYGEFEYEEYTPHRLEKLVFENSDGIKTIVITGGEIFLKGRHGQILTVIQDLREAGCYVILETCGQTTIPDDCKVDWLVVTPQPYNDYNIILEEECINEIIIQEHYKVGAKLLDAISEVYPSPLKSIHPRDCDRDSLKRCIKVSTQTKYSWPVKLEVNKIIGVR